MSVSEQPVEKPAEKPAEKTAEKPVEKPSLKRLSVLRRLIGLMAPHKGRFALATVSLFIGSAMGLLYPQAARMAVDIGLSEESAFESKARLDQIALALVAVFLLHSLLTWLRHYLMSWLGERVVADLRKRVFDRLVALPLSWFHERRTGEITGRLAADVATVENIVGSQLSVSLRDMVSLFGGVTLLFVENWRLTLIMLGIVPPIVLGVLLFGRRIRKMSKAVQDRFAETSAHVQEVIGAMATVQSFVREKRESERYGDEIEKYFKDKIELASWRGLFFATMSFAGWFGIAITVWFGGRAVLDGSLTAGDLAAFMLYTFMVAASLGSLAGLWGSLQSAAGATERLFAILDETPAIRDPEVPVDLPPRASAPGEVRFDAVTFAYPSRASEDVVKNISLDVKAGEVVALVGRSGSGKTTLTALLQRFYDPREGRVLVDGVDVKTARLADLRARIATVSQEPVLFSGTIAENIAYARPSASRDEVLAAAKEAHADEFIERFADQYEAKIGERGVKLSGGQRQRIAIARALLADPRVLILDEATSSLDAESEALVQAALARLMKGRTTLVIAHRLSTVRDADRIVVLDKGEVVEQGTHDALMNARGTYWKLVEHQVVLAEA
jgi:ABC transporter fused permease/ATP-binding protein